MSEIRDLENMMEILDLAIARQEAEEAFFRRSADASTNPVAKAMFSEIADDLKRYREGLEARKRKLRAALDDLKAGRKSARAADEGEEAEGERDPVCGMKVDPQKGEHISTYDGRAYYFCSLGCKKAFELDPGKYTRG